MNFKKIICLIVPAFFLCVFVGGILFAAKYGVRFYKLRREAKALVKEFGENAFSNKGTSEVYSSDGEIIAYLRGTYDSYYIKMEDIPYMVKWSFITTEDRNFYTHKGIDIRGVARAFVAYVKNKGEVTQGGSTITQQLARNIYLSYEVTMDRKIKEMFIAMELEEKYSKDEILEFYINNIYFANGYYGIEAAARGYFDKSINDLNMSEMVFLCAIPNNPTLYDPISNYDNTLERRDRIVKQLIEAEVIDGELGKEITDTEIVLSQKQRIRHNYVETYVRYCATIELMKLRGFNFRNDYLSVLDKSAYEKSFNEAYGECNSMLFSGGYKIYTTIDMTRQSELQAVLDEKLSVDNEKTDEGIYKLQGSAVCIDNRTGYVIAIVGGRSADYNGYTLNRAFQSFRQPGSAIKPLLVYTPLFERGYTPDTKVVDEKFTGGPKNYPNVYEGEMTLRRAVEVSKNTVAWKLFEQLTPIRGFEYLLKMGFSKIVSDDYVPAAAIGGMTHGLSALDMASGYATIANDGIYRESTCISKIEDAMGNVIVENTRHEMQVYEKNAARMMTDVLKGIMTRGTGKDYNIDNAICAGKTGTTNNNYDKWMTGYSRYYTLSVWCGYDYPKYMSDGGRSYAGEIWRDYMEYLHDGLSLLDFPSYVDKNVPGENDADDETSDATSDTTDEYDGIYTENWDENNTATYEDMTAPEEMTGFEDMTQYEDTTEYENMTEPDNAQDEPEPSGDTGMYDEVWD